MTTATIMRSGHLPTPQLGIISDIERAIKALARTQSVKERLCEYIQQEVNTISNTGPPLLPMIGEQFSKLICVINRNTSNLSLTS